MQITTRNSSGEIVTNGQNTYLCVLLNASRDPLFPDCTSGSTCNAATEEWSWDRNGTVLMENLDTSSDDDGRALAAFTVSKQEQENSGMRAIQQLCANNPGVRLCSQLVGDCVYSTLIENAYSDSQIVQDVNTFQSGLLSQFNSEFTSAISACDSSRALGGLEAAQASAGTAAPSTTGHTDTSSSASTNSTAQTCPNSSVTISVKGTSCAKADALLAALPDQPIGPQTFNRWDCDTPTEGGQTTCTLNDATVAFAPKRSLHSSGSDPHGYDTFAQAQKAAPGASPAPPTPGSVCDVFLKINGLTLTSNQGYAGYNVYAAGLSCTAAAQVTSSFLRSSSNEQASNSGNVMQKLADGWTCSTGSYRPSGDVDDPESFVVCSRPGETATAVATGD